MRWRKAMDETQDGLLAALHAVATLRTVVFSNEKCSLNACSAAS
jgi:hypothetical protein